MTDAPLSPADEAAVQLIVNTIIGRAKMPEEKMVPADVVRRQLAAIGQDMVAMQQRVERLEWMREALSRAECKRQGLDPDDIIADGGHLAWHLVGYEAAVKEMPEPQLVSLGACRGGPTLALSDVANGIEEECVLCRMIVRADQVEHPVLGFKARCEK